MHRREFLKHGVMGYAAIAAGGLAVTHNRVFSDEAIEKAFKPIGAEEVLDTRLYLFSPTRHGVGVRAVGAVERLNTGQQLNTWDARIKLADLPLEKFHSTEWLEVAGLPPQDSGMYAGRLSARVLTVYPQAYRFNFLTNAMPVAQLDEQTQTAAIYVYGCRGTPECDLPWLHRHGLGDRDFS